MGFLSWFFLEREKKIVLASGRKGVHKEWKRDGRGQKKINFFWCAVPYGIPVLLTYADVLYYVLYYIKKNVSWRHSSSPHLSGMVDFASTYFTCFFFVLVGGAALFLTCPAWLVRTFFTGFTSTYFIYFFAATSWWRCSFPRFSSMTRSHPYLVRRATSRYTGFTSAYVSIR